jgi:penicillin-binding protein 1B
MKGKMEEGPRFRLSLKLSILLGVAAGIVAVGLGTLAYFYVHYAHLIDAKLTAGPFQSTAMIFAAPRSVSVGDQSSPAEIVYQLRRSGYTEAQDSRMGWYHLRPDAVEIYPGVDSYFLREPAVLKFAGGRVSEVFSLSDHTERTQYLLEPELITNLFDRNREKRRLVKYKDIPKVLIEAVVSAEDKRFFQHAGFDPLRIIKAAYVDLRQHRKEQGASTLSMQLARSLWLDQKKTWRRKAAEVLMTLHLEQKLSKEQIFEDYANEVYLGRRGSFSIQGFGEGAQVYFGKSIQQLTLPEAALLAGLIQRPGAYNPFRSPDRAQARRNVILGLMRDNGYITEPDYQQACAAASNIGPEGPGSSDAPYFVDLVNDTLQNKFQDYDFQSQSYRVFTTLDLNLQRAAGEAVRLGMKEVDQQLAKRHKPGEAQPEAQVALVALDPDSGEVKALVGGRNYGASQLDHAVAKRQPGSVFKPFVYTAAMETALSDGTGTLTPATMVDDEPTTFWYDNKPYEPANFMHEYHGEVTLREALAKSMNVATVKVAQAVGYEKVVDVARRLGLNMQIRATPAVALGAYEVTPVEIAGAYTAFADGGVYTQPEFIKLIRDQGGDVIYTTRTVRKQVLDPRVAYLMVSLMQEVLHSGTGAGVRARGFTLPAAGKTGTSHDGWFAGFTSRLLCVVWVGFDDNRELGLEGARSALPIWTEFMKRAHQFREYRNVRYFEAPNGIVTVSIDPESGQLATPQCPTTRPEIFIAGTQPIESCHLHQAAQPSPTYVATWEAPAAVPEPPKIAGAPPSASGLPAVTPAHKPPPPAPETAQAQPLQEERPKKRGLFRRMLDVFK